jgi:tetratricopeptide (TPR) repeat protein
MPSIHKPEYRLQRHAGFFDDVAIAPPGRKREQESGRRPRPLGDIPAPSGRKSGSGASLSSPELSRVVRILAQGKGNEAAGTTEEQLDALYALGHRLFSAGSYPDAITIFTSLCLRDHGNRLFWMGLGGSLQGAGKFERAIDAYGMAGLCGALDDPESFYRIALCHLKQKRVDAANRILDVIARMGGDGDAAQATFRQEIAELRESLTTDADGSGPPECAPPEPSSSSRRARLSGASHR